MRLLLVLIVAAILAGNLSACAPVAVGAAASAGVMAADRRTTGIYIEDEAIEWKSQKRISEALGDRIHINSTSFNRNVLLTGEAIDEDTMKEAESIAQNVENVRNVINELDIAGASSLVSRSNDSYLTSKVKARMITEKKFPSKYVKVVTENSTVYLMGLVTREEAKDAVDIARNIDGVKKVVIVFEYITQQ